MALEIFMLWVLAGLGLLAVVGLALASWAAIVVSGRISRDEIGNLDYWSGE